MLRSELIERICSKNTSLTFLEVDAAVRCILSSIEGALSEGRRVEVRGFGVFTVKHLKARQARNPKTGESLIIDDKYKVQFKPGKELRERVNAALIV